jgi:hypothetical protein
MKVTLRKLVKESEVAGILESSRVCFGGKKVATVIVLNPQKILLPIMKEKADVGEHCLHRLVQSLRCSELKRLSPYANVHS